LGAELIQSIFKDEERLLGPVFDRFDEDRLAAATQTLSEIRSLLETLKETQ